MVHFTLISTSLVSFIGKEKYRKHVLFFCFFALFLFAIFRYGLGNDYFSYQKWYVYINRFGENPFEEEILFTWLNQISPSYYFLIFITSLVFLFAIYMLVIKNVDPKYIGFSFLIFVINPYLFLMNLSALRQATALSIFILAISFSRRNKIVPYVLLIIVASLFHKSAIVLLPFYFIANEKKVKMWQLLTYMAVVLVLLINTEAMNNVIQNFLEFFETTDYERYMEGDGNSVRATILSAIYLLYLLINIRRVEGSTLLFSKLYIFGITFAVLAFNISMFTRLQMYFDVFSIVAIPGIMKQNIENEYEPFDKLINVYIFPALIFTIYVLRYYSFFTNPLWESFTTYKTIFGV